MKTNKRLKEEASKQSIMAHPKHTKKFGGMNVLIKPPRGCFNRLGN